jgi:predicted kinase
MNTHRRTMDLFNSGHTVDRLAHYTGIPRHVLVRRRTFASPIDNTADVLIVPRGVMGSGKSTWIEDVVAGRVTLPHLPAVPRVASRDAWRAKLGYPPLGDAWQEQDVTRRVTHEMWDGFEAGFPVIIDAMHLDDRQVQAWDTPGRLVIVADFRGVPVDVCVERMLARKAAGGRGVDARTPERDEEILRGRHAEHIAGRTDIPTGPAPTLYGWGFTPAG